MKKYIEFIQLGDEEQCRDNGLGPEWTYYIGQRDEKIKREVSARSYKVRGAYGTHGTWNVDTEYRTSFKLTLIF